MHLHRYEKFWLIFGGTTLVVFLVIIGISGFLYGHLPPGHAATFDPLLVDETAPFDEPGLVQIDENTYQANIVAMAFGYQPSTIEIPKGSEVIFQVTSKDVIHSYTIPHTNVNMMVMPGYISMARHTFDEAGNYLVICNEYCGSGHHFMHMNIEVIE